MITKRLLDVCDFQGGTQPPKDEWINDPREGYVRMLQIRDYSQGDAKFIHRFSIPEVSFIIYFRNL